MPVGKIISAGKYTPFGHTDYQQIIAEIKQFAASGDACIINTLNGDTNVPFFKEYAAAGLDAESCPVVSFSVSEDEFRGLPASQLVGQLGCWTYFQSIKSPANAKFVADFQAWLAKSDVPGIVKEGRVTCSPMVLSYNGVYLWKAAVEKAGSFDVDKVNAALESGMSFDGPGGNGHHPEEPPPDQERLYRRNQAPTGSSRSSRNTRTSSASRSSRAPISNLQLGCCAGRSAAAMPFRGHGRSSFHVPAWHERCSRGIPRSSDP
jgi:hypothetical protein